MLKKIKLKNYRSFKNETIFDLKSTKYTILEKSNTRDGLLNGLVFVGSNASGKSNALKSIALLLDMLLVNKNINVKMQMCLFSDDPMELTYWFEFDNQEICYEIVFDRTSSIVKEVLSIDNKIYLNRIGQNAESYLTENRYYKSDSIDSETLFLKNIYFNTKFSNFPILKKWFEFLQNSIYCDFSKQKSFVFSPTVLVDLKENMPENDIHLMNEFFRKMNINQEIKYDSSCVIGKNTKINTGDKKAFYLKKDNCDYWMPLSMESEGNKALVRFLPAMIHILRNDGMIIIDEFNSTFHNKLEELIVKYILKYSDKSQLFIATHSTNLLKNSLIRPDQIYVVDFLGNEGSKVNRVSNEKPRESQNIEKMYLSGMFGGIPNYRNDL